MELKIIDADFSVCQIKDIQAVDFSKEYVFVGKTDEELSLVCSTDSVPQECIAAEEGWKAFRVQGILDFSLVGILSKLSSILADSGISIFAVSTFNTDYILVKKERLEEAARILERNGFEVIL
ncbi:ACT domain-containing protein [Anoxybacterium hadale]|uniref:ACT domain-containing protein n=1 Tax=Anoxybacterium hadale TaxID=3408580 RepID=A0ACD1AFJ2_9FIRM|nr:ACT domain-containing protein [Clostridiales bacterium]